MRKLFLIFMLLFFSLLVSAEELKPLADFGVHTIVTSGPKVYEGRNIRAILIYGELGAPTISIEAIEVLEGYPVQSKVLWREKIDVTGGTKGICKGSEGVWSCYLENLRWEDSTLNYEIKNFNKTYKCSAEVTSIDAYKIKTMCSKHK